MTDAVQPAELGNLPPFLYPERIEQMKAMYREQQGLAPDAEVVFLPGADPGTAYLYQPGTFVRLDGGTLDLTAWGWLWLRWRVRVRRLWGWLRYGWRWW